MKAIDHLPKGWRLADPGRLVRDVLLVPGMTIQWLAESFDKVEHLEISRVGRDDVSFAEPFWDGDPWPASECYASLEAAQVVLARRVAADLIAGRSSCPCCRCRDESVVRILRGRMFCGHCHQVWKVAPAKGGRR